MQKSISYTFDSWSIPQQYRATAEHTLIQSGIVLWRSWEWGMQTMKLNVAAYSAWRKCLRFYKKSTRVMQRTIVDFKLPNPRNKRPPNHLTPSSVLKMILTPLLKSVIKLMIFLSKWWIPRRIVCSGDSVAKEPCDLDEKKHQQVFDLVKGFPAHIFEGQYMKDHDTSRTYETYFFQFPRGIGANTSRWNFCHNRILSAWPCTLATRPEWYNIILFKALILDS